MTRSTRPDLNRRTVLAAGGGLSLAALLAACGSGSGGSAAGPSGAGATSSTSGEWTFTDDRNKKITEKSTPQRVVAFTGTAAALWDFGVRDSIVGVFGETKLPDGSATPLAGDLDLSKVTIIGNAYGQFDLEKFLSTNPDLLATDAYTPNELWYVPAGSVSKIEAVAPTLAINTAWVSMIKPIEKHQQLAAALGADQNAADVTAAKKRFDAAAQAVRDAVKANPGITVLACSAATDIFYASNPKYAADLIYFASLGVQFVQPTKLDKGDYFQSLSWENAGTYPADILLLDNRSTSLQPKDLTGNAAWTALPAVKADQVTGWDTVPRFSYAGVAPNLERLAAAIKTAKKL
ncbi:ABC transporter substrate-binding protein [Rudaeicoccus suwonensis]|uniref:Iron complex transport system substrate-binding protein n=1 Tax=Rudaeicoccus suwonensis TaxID=657409 RepID=A0A561E7Z7_9MICO|nr:ABC transporter substrate-binding protein [Rudaeicoccus suwonensis]TWE11738.1 iron complex transport system substrate-binding protein [Rudaeicoccus suwonensis]